jgi:predicted GNAT family N-acyltransferase
MLHCSEIEFSTPEYDVAVRIRTEILRKPIGLEFTIEQLSAEWSDTHIACFDARENMVGCLILTKKDQKTLKMRQVAVSKICQNQGVGQSLVAFSEKWARQNGFGKIILNARETAVPFYLKLNYLKIGEPFEEVGMPHFFMEKKMSS